MKHHLIYLRFTAVALAFALVALVGSAAHAFIVNTQGATDSDDGAKFGDQDDQVQNLISSGGTSSSQSGRSVQFGTQPANAGQYGPAGLQPLAPRSLDGGSNN
jgi:hypothetical protein